MQAYNDSNTAPNATPTPEYRVTLDGKTPIIVLPFDCSRIGATVLIRCVAPIPGGGRGVYFPTLDRYTIGRETRQISIMQMRDQFPRFYAKAHLELRLKPVFNLARIAQDAERLDDD